MSMRVPAVRTIGGRTQSVWASRTQKVWERVRRGVYDGEKGATSKMSIRKMLTSRTRWKEKKKGLYLWVMSEPNLAKAQALVVAWRFVLPSYSSHLSRSIYRCTLDRMNRTGLSHYAWNPLRVCECDKSICYDVQCLDSQRDRGAMTRVVRTPFALTRLRPEGKCSDTAASRRKMPWHSCVQKENALTRSVW